MITALLTFYILFVVIRDGQEVAYRLWSLYHDYVYKPYKSRRGWHVQYASMTCPPFRWVKKT